jgi:hypothetical protein
MTPSHVHGAVYCVWDRTLGWRSPRKCRPCVIVSVDGMGGVTVVPRATHPRDPVAALPSAMAPPTFDRAGFFVPIEYPISTADLLDHRGMCPAADLAAVIMAIT